MFIPVVPPHGKKKKQKKCICKKTKAQISFAVAAKLISAFVFATRTVQSLYFLNTKFHASICLLLLCSPVCVGPGRNPNCWFSHVHAHINIQAKDLPLKLIIYIQKVGF